MSRGRVATMQVVRGVVLAAMFAACAGWSTAWAQSSTNYKLQGGAPTGFGASGTSANFRVVGGELSAAGRFSATNYDGVPGLIGAAFSSQATVNLTTGAGGYVGLAVPVRTANSAVTSVFASLGGVDNTRWRLGHWSPADSAYLEPGTSLPLNSVATGQGYWLITKDAANVAVTGLPVHPVDPFKTALTSGPGGRPAWNMLGNPFLYPVPVGLMFVDGGILGIFNVTAGTNTLTEHTIKVRSGGSYVDATVVNGRTAFWIRKLVSQNVTLYIPAIPAATGSPAPTLQKPDGATWAVAINGLQAGRASETLWLGAAPLAGNGWNSMASSRAPSPPGVEDLSLFVHRQNWAEMSGDYVRDFQPAAERMSWDVTLAGAQGPGEVGIALKGFDVPAGMHFYLTDPVAGWTREVKPGDGVHVAVGTAAKSLRFEAALGGSPVETTPAADGFRVAYPNPFRGATGLSFTLAHAGAIQADIFDVQGRVIRSLRNANASAGDHVLVWDGSDRNGSRMGSGVYLVRWRAGAATGVARLIRVD